MKWEELKVYKPLAKEELKPAFKDFTKIIADNFRKFGFTLHGRKLIALSNDLLQVIHIDTRGSWSGINEYFKTEISLVVLSNKSPFLRGMELTGRKKIEEIAIGIRDNYRITREYSLLADFLTRRIIENVLPYFDKYNVSKEVLNNYGSFTFGNFQENEELILFAELQNRTNIHASQIIDKELARHYNLSANNPKAVEYLEELNVYKQGLLTNNWITIERKLESNKIEVLKKLRMKLPNDNVGG